MHSLAVRRWGMPKAVKKPVTKPAKKRAAKLSSDSMTRGRPLITERRPKAGGPRKRTVTLSELGVMLDGPGPFDDARVLAKSPLRLGDLSADKITPKSVAARARRKKRPKS
jgi:hypothetical protein